MFGSPLTIGSPSLCSQPRQARAAVERVKVQTNVAARDRVIDKLRHGLFHLCRRRRVQTGRPADNRLEHLVHPVLGGDVVDEQQQPFTERRQWRVRLREGVGGCEKLLGLVALDRRDQRVPGGEMAVEGPGPDTSGPRDLIEAGGRSIFCESGFHRFEQAEAVALRIGSRLTDSGGFALIGNPKTPLDKRRVSPRS
jgi:hypothetical protein